MDKNIDKSKFLLPAGLFIGIGVGLITGQVAGFALIGFGLGFLATYWTGKKNSQ